MRIADHRWLQGDIFKREFLTTSGYEEFLLNRGLLTGGGYDEFSIEDC